MVTKQKFENMVKNKMVKNKVVKNKIVKKQNG